MCGVMEPQKTDLFFKWDAMRTLSHPIFFSNRVWNFLSSLHRHQGTLCISVLLEEEGKKTLQFVWILLHLVLHMAIFYFKMAKEIGGKCTYILNVSDLKLNLCIRK